MVTKISFFSGGLELIVASCGVQGNVGLKAFLEEAHSQQELVKEVRLDALFAHISPFQWKETRQYKDFHPLQGIEAVGTWPEVGKGLFQNPICIRRPENGSKGGFLPSRQAEDQERCLGVRREEKVHAGSRAVRGQEGGKTLWEEPQFQAEGRLGSLDSEGPNALKTL